MAGKGAVTLARWRELPPAKFSPHARPGAAPREPGPMETLASHVSSEPGRGGLFARAGTGWGVVQETKHRLAASRWPGSPICRNPNTP